MAHVCCKICVGLVLYLALSYITWCSRFRTPLPKQKTWKIALQIPTRSRSKTRVKVISGISLPNYSTISPTWLTISKLDRTDKCGIYWDIRVSIISIFFSFFKRLKEKSYMAHFEKKKLFI